MLKKKFRNIAAWSVSLLLISLGVTRRIKKKAMNGDFILSVYFHSPSRELFEFCIKWLIKNNFHFLSQDDVLSISRNNSPFPKGAVVVTLDDGWETNEANVVQIADKYKVPVAIFVSTGCIEDGGFWWPYVTAANKLNGKKHSVEYLKTIPDSDRVKIVSDIKKTVQLKRAAMSVDQIKNIAKSRYITLGSHTVSHPILVNCGDNESYDELKESKEILEGWINKSVNSFAFPNGDYGLREIRFLKETGYELAYTTVPAYLTKPLIQNAYELPRFVVFENVSGPEAICRMLGVWQNVFENHKMPS